MSTNVWNVVIQGFVVMFLCRYLKINFITNATSFIWRRVNKLRYQLFVCLEKFTLLINPHANSCWNNLSNFSMGEKSKVPIRFAVIWIHYFNLICNFQTEYKTEGQNFISYIIYKVYTVSNNIAMIFYWNTYVNEIVPKWTHACN